jgi:hypothetical protein
VEARNLGWLAEARIRCRELGVDRFAVHKVRAVVRIHPSSTLPLTSLDALCAALPNRFKRVAERELEVRFSLDEGSQPFRLIDWVCGKLAEPPAAPLGGFAPPGPPRPPPPPDPKAAPDAPRAPMRRIAKKTSWRP